MIKNLAAYLYESATPDQTWRVMFSWVFAGKTFGETPVDVHIGASSSADRLFAADYDVFDSGLPKITNFSFVPGEIPAPPETSVIYWRVSISDETGEEHHSEPAELIVPPPSVGIARVPWISAAQTRPAPAKSDGANDFVVDLRQEVPIARVEFTPICPTYFRLDASLHADLSDSTCLVDHQSSPYSYVGKGARSFETKRMVVRYLKFSGVICPRESLTGVPLEVLITPDGRRGMYGYKVPEEIISCELPELQHLSEESAPNFLLKRAFSVRSGLVSAACTYTGLGYCHLFLNGEPMNNDVLWPPFTNYLHRVYTRSLDLSTHLQPGTNVIGTSLGNGFRSLATPDIFGHQRCEWTGAPSFLCELVLTYSDGRQERIVTDESWHGRTGQVLFNCIRGGETMSPSPVDREELRCSEITADWQPCRIVQSPGGRLLPDSSLPIVRREPTRPVKLSETAAGTLVADFGVTQSGCVEFKASGNRDGRVVVRSNDMLLHDGSVDIGNCSMYTYGRFQTDVGILSGNSGDFFQPAYSYKSFRYAEFLGDVAAVDRESIRAVHIANETAFAGSIEFSDERIAGIHRICLQSFLSAFHGIPDDGAREKMGWLGEAGMNSYAQCLSFQLHRMLRKWLFDMLDTQNPDGLICNMAPENGMWHRPAKGAPPPSHNDPWWCGSLIVVAWNLYLFYGDKEILRIVYPAAERLMAYINQHSNRGIVPWNLGDWIEVGSRNFPQRTPVAMTSTMGFKYLSDLMASMAEVVDEPEGVRKYQRLGKRIRSVFCKSFREKYLDPALNSQSVWAMMLALDMCPTDERDKLLSLLKHNIVDEYEGHLSTGTMGTFPLLTVLSEHGCDDLLDFMLTTAEYPGYGYMIKCGATAVWEAWNGLESQNHNCYTRIDEFLYLAFGALGPAWISGVGRCLLISPGRPKALGNCRIEQQQTFFTSVSDWSVDEDCLRARIEWDAEVPVLIDLKKLKQRGESCHIKLTSAGSFKTIQGYQVLPKKGRAELTIRQVSASSNKVG